MDDDRGLTRRPRGGEVHVGIVNTLGGTLAHYEAEVSSTIKRSGGETPRVVSVLEPSMLKGRFVRLRWLLKSYREIVRSSRLNEAVIVTWPILGYWDLLVFAVLRRRNVEVVFHDPVPLHRTPVGWGGPARWAASLVRSRLIVHTQQAREDLPRRLQESCVVLRHPVTCFRGDRTSGGSSGADVLVFGQYKPDRDVKLLRELPGLLSGASTFRVRGRGWPSIPGWDADSSFVPEEDVDDLLAASAVVVVPYRRFYQSGVAVRALETGTVPVGPRCEFMETLLGDGDVVPRDGTPLSWANAVRSALEGTVDPSELHASYAAKVDADWAAWLSDLGRH